MFDLIGKTVGPYRILEQVGVGGMATVYKAYQANMDRDIALKILPIHLSNDPEFTKRFQREARAIARLEHAHILPVYDYGEADGVTYIAMRYIKAGTLRDHMSKGQLSLEEINRIIGQVGNALDYAHRMGVIHRDIKPGNVLMDDQGDTYLSDFGLARMMEPSQKLTASGVGLGTPAYMSPEQGQGVKVDHRSDIYSLGIILYEMVAGHVPFEAETPMAVVLKHITDPLPLPHTINPNVPEKLERVILKALAKDPADRYQTAGEMIHALNAAVIANIADLQQKHITSRLESVREDVSIISRLQHSWEQPRGRVLLTGSALALIVIIGLWLSQLSDTVAIISPIANGTASPIAQVISTTDITPTTFPTNTVVPTTIPSTATSASPVISANGQWEQLYGGSSFLPVALNALAVDPNDPNKIFAGTVGAGIYVSRDGGETWDVSNNGLGKGTVGSITIDPNNSKIIYAGLFDKGGIYKSIDGGRTWQASYQGIDLDNGATWLGLIKIDPKNSQHLYYTGSDQLFQSTNGGISWTQQSNDCLSIMALAIDPVNGDHLYAASRTGSEECPAGVYETMDAGRTWIQLTTVDMARESGDWWHVAADPRNFNTLYAGSWSSTYKSSDAGKTWVRIHDTGCWWLAVHPDNGTVYCGRQGEMYVSHNAGISWEHSSFGPDWGSGERFPFALVPDTQTIYAGTDGIMRSNDDGKTWNFIKSFGLPRMRLTVDSRVPNRLYLGGWPGTPYDLPCNSYRSEDGGVSWQAIIANSAGGCILAFDIPNSTIYRTAGFEIDLYRSTNNGNYWESFGGDFPPENEMRQVIPQPDNPNRLWLITNGPGFYRSDDGGKTFVQPKELSNGIWDAILLTHLVGKRLYLISHNAFYRSDDSGDSWQLVSNPGGMYLAGAIDPSDPNALYVGSTYKGMFKSTSGGRFWNSLSNLLATSINDIAIDPNNTQIVYAATNNGAFVSKNGGEDWTRLQEGLGPNPIVYSIAIDPNGSSKVYAVTPDGVYQFVNDNELSQMRLNPDLALKDAISSAKADSNAAFAATALQAILERDPSYQDDFFDPTRGFGENHEGGGFARNNNGVYLMEAPLNGFSNSYNGSNFYPHSDLVVQLDMRVDAFQSAYPREGQIFLRWGSSGSYGFSLNYDSPTMYYQLGIHQQSLEYVELAKGRPFWAATDTQVGTWHNVIAMVIGNKLAYFIDGVLVAAITDDTLVQGSFLVGAGSGTAMQVDNLRIWDVSDLR